MTMRPLWLFRRSITGCVGLWLIMLTIIYIYLVNGPAPGGEAKPRQLPSHLAAMPEKLDSIQPLDRVEAAYIVPPMKIPDMVEQSQRVAEYCNHPAYGVKGFEGEVPPGYKLLSVHIATRHGDRTSLSGFQNHPNPVISCQMEPHTVLFHPKLRSFAPTMYAYAGKQHPNSGFKNWALFPDKKQCNIAELTGQGALQHLLLGDHLNKQYIHKWQLFDGNFTPYKILVRATEYSRTYQSAIAFLYGFLPQFNLTELNIHRSSSIYFCDYQYANLPCVCPGLLSLRGNVVRSGKNKESSKDLIRHIGEVYGLKPSQLLWKTAMIDVFMAHACHDKPLRCNEVGKCITKNTLDQLWYHVDEAGLSHLTKVEKIDRVAMHPLLVEIAQRMKNISKNINSPRFVLFSGHDTTVTPLATALGIYNGHWPPYATRVVFEQYAKTVNDEIEHFIRVLYNGKDVTSKVRFCDNLQEDGFCALEHFLSFVNKDNLADLNIKTYEEACRPGQ